MSEEFRKFLKNYQNFLRNCDRFTEEIAVTVFDDSNDYIKDSEITSEQNTKINEEIKVMKLNDETMIEAAENFGFEIIIDENSNEEMTNQALCLLNDVVCSLRRNTNIFYDNNIINSIIDLLYHPNTEIKINTLKLILSLSQGSRKPMNLFIKNNLLSVLLELLNLELNESEKDTIFHMIISIASNIASLSSKKVHYLIQLGYSNLILKSINEGNINVQLAAALFSSNIMTKGLISDIQNNINIDIINNLFEFLDEEYDPRLHRCILDGIFNCLQNNIYIEKIPMQTLLRNELYLPVLYSCLVNKDEYIAELSQCIINLIEKQ